MSTDPLLAEAERLLRDGRMKFTGYRENGRTFSFTATTTEDVTDRINELIRTIEYDLRTNRLALIDFGVVKGSLPNEYLLSIRTRWCPLHEPNREIRGGN